MAKNATYIITAEEAFHDELERSSLTAARQARKMLQESADAQEDVPPIVYKIYKIEEIQ